MKLVEILFVFLAFTVIKGAILVEATGETIVQVPQLDNLPSFQYKVPDKCDSVIFDFVDCTAYLADIIKVFVKILVDIGMLTGLLFKYIGQLMALIFTITFASIEDAPAWVNLLLFTPYLASLVIIIYRIFRTGDDEAS